MGGRKSAIYIAEQLHFVQEVRKDKMYILSFHGENVVKNWESFSMNALRIHIW